ncbi:hypothetical protein ACIPPS_27705 [Streptomyces sp. NPDC090127]|uniref:hypothetical protein n=1 Tax=Streptomyces sp. NPDC090127 TaxID=3365953 RepID=UPI0038282C4C
MNENALEIKVARELRIAGLFPSSFSEPRPGGFGLQSEGAKVAVVWVPSGVLTEVAFKRLGAGDVEHPSVLHMGVVKQAMGHAIVQILRSAGLNAGMSADEFSPGIVEVTDPAPPRPAR